MELMSDTPARHQILFRLLNPEPFAVLVRRTAGKRLPDAGGLSDEQLLALPEALVCGLVETYAAAIDIGCDDAQAHRLLQRYDMDTALCTPLAQPFDFEAYVAARLAKRGCPLEGADLKRALEIALPALEREALRSRKKIGPGPTHNDLSLASSAMDRDAWTFEDRSWFETLRGDEDFQAIVMALHIAPDFSALDVAQAEQVLAAAYTVFYHDTFEGQYANTVCRYLTGLPNGSGSWLSGVRAAVANAPMHEEDRARLQGALYGIDIILSIIEGHTKTDRSPEVR
jgi:hypothetical protein